MTYPRQTKVCECCEGYKRVAIITRGPPLLEQLVGKPIPMTFIRARKLLANYRGSDAGSLTMFVRELAHNLDTRPCPWCRATGVAYAMQQLTPEEAARIRAEEEGIG